MLTISYDRVTGEQKLSKRAEYDALFQQLTTRVDSGWFEKACEHDKYTIRIVAREGDRIVGFAL